MRKQELIDKVSRTIGYAYEYIAEYEKQGHDFDPFRLLMGQETQAERLFRLSVTFLHDIEELTDTYRESRLPKGNPIPTMTGNFSWSDLDAMEDRCLSDMA